jgi:hypothetical protein
MQCTSIVLSLTGLSFYIPQHLVFPPLETGRPDDPDFTRARGPRAREGDSDGPDLRACCLITGKAAAEAKGLVTNTIRGP